jgi:hypothetical protein
MLRRGMTIHPHHCILSLMSPSVYIKDIIGIMNYAPCIGDIKESGPLTHPSYITLPMMVVRYSLNTLGLSTMNLVRL